MFPTFISILDIQSWWEVPSIAHFCSLFRTAFNLLDFDIEDLEEALLADGTEEASWLQELIVRLLSGCLPHNEISTFNYQMFLRRLFRQKCQEHDQYNPFNTDTDFQLLPLRTKVDILAALCDFRLDADDVLDQLKNLEADSLRVEPLGYDNNESAYWYFYGTRLYREDFNTKNNKKKSVWQVICFTEADWFQLNKKFKKSAAKCERQLYRTLDENFLPELPRLFEEKERLARKRLLENRPRRTSDRLKKVENVVIKPAKQTLLSSLEEKEEKLKKRQLEKKRREAYERRNRLKDEDSEEKSSLSEGSEVRYEMGANKKPQPKKSKSRQGKLSDCSTNSKDAVPKGTKRKKNDESSSSSTPKAVGRQTNNSLSAATGQIVIQSSAAHPHKKKLKTSQVFRQTDEDLVVGMHKILDSVKNHEDAWPFVDPVDEDYAPNYYSVIRKPMDLQRMEERLDAGYYKSYSKFRDDFQLIIDNCRLYNGAENEYTEMVDTLSKAFERATAKFLDQISSSDDEIAVEFHEKSAKEAKSLKLSTSETIMQKSSKRKPTLAAKTDRKREKSVSEDELSEPLTSKKVGYLNDSEDDKTPISNSKHKSKDRKEKEKKSSNKTSQQSPSKKERVDKSDAKKSAKDKKGSTKISSSSNKHVKKEKKIAERGRSASRSQSPPKRDYSSSPPPSSPENLHDITTKKQKNQAEKHQKDALPKSKLKHKQERLKELFDDDIIKKTTESSPLSKPKDKHDKLRETIEKLKAKSEISNKLTDVDEYCFEFDTLKENNKKDKDLKTKNRKDRLNKAQKLELEEKRCNASPRNENSPKKQPKKLPKNSNTNNKNAAIEALSIATEQTLKDINKWLDDTPKFNTDFSSASNSPSYGPLDDLDTLTSKSADNSIDPKKLDKAKLAKDQKRRPFNRDPAKFLKRREIQRTIDRLQPGKSKGNLITNVQPKQVDDGNIFTHAAKKLDAKNSLLVKSDENVPKLSLGTVLDINFGKHKFEDLQKNESSVEVKPKLEETTKIEDAKIEEIRPKIEETTKDEIKARTSAPIEESAIGGATPNLSAWFKAFGAPKVAPNPKKADAKPDGVIKEPERPDEPRSEPKPNEDTLVIPSAKISPPEASPSGGSPAACAPISRQRRISTGSSMSERSSFSQDMDSPRVGMDERLGAYPAPYPSPMHRSPSGASPQTLSPAPSSPKTPYPPFNGHMRVGFYQDTVGSNKSSPDKSCSPRDNPQSPYNQQNNMDHVYPPNTTSQNIAYSYPNSPYYSHSTGYTNQAYNPPVGGDVLPNPPNYYDTSKSLTDQYQAKSNQNYAHSPLNVVPPQSPHVPQSTDQNYQTIDNTTKMAPTSAAFPVKKRTFMQSNADDVQEPMKYVHQNIPEPKALQLPANLDAYGQKGAAPMYSSAAPPYAEPTYPLRQKLELGKYTNLGYSAPEAVFSRGMQQYNRPELSYTRPGPNGGQAQPAVSYANANSLHNLCYKGMEVTSNAQPQQAHATYTNASSSAPNEVTIPRPTYNPPHLELAEHSLRGNIANLSHIVERYGAGSGGGGADERYGLQGAPGQYYGDNKGLGSAAATQMFSKAASGAGNGGGGVVSGLGGFNHQANVMSGAMQGYGQQGGMTGTGLYNRGGMGELGVASSGLSEVKSAPVVEKKAKRKKSNKNAQAGAATLATADATSTPPNSQQGFQSYAGLKSAPNPPASIEPSAISLKTASVVPGSAFNFGPTPLGPPSGLYHSDKDAYPNFLEDFRPPPNYYIAGGHNRPPPGADAGGAGSGDKQARAVAGSGAAYPFMGAPQGRPPPAYGLPNPFMASAQAPLMDASSPLYQHYLHMNQGLLGSAAYPPGYHPALSMRQQYDSMTRPPWL